MDYYKILGVDKDATSEQLRKAYRTKAKELHPDREGGDAEGMAAVNRAYATLSDPELRQRYDSGTDRSCVGNPIDNEAHAVLVGLVSYMVDQGGEYIAANVKSNLQTTLSQLNKTIATDLRRRAQLEGKIGKVVGTDLVDKILREGLERLDSRLLQLGAQKTTFERAIEMCEEWADVIPVQTQFAQPTGVQTIMTTIVGGAGSGGAGGSWA